MSQDPGCGRGAQEWRSRPLEVARAALGTAIPSFRSTSIRLQKRFGILTDEDRRIGVRKKPSQDASSRPPGSERDSAPPLGGVPGRSAFGGSLPKNGTLTSLRTILSNDTTEMCNACVLRVLWTKRVPARNPSRTPLWRRLQCGAAWCFGQELVCSIGSV